MNDDINDRSLFASEQIMRRAKKRFSRARLGLNLSQSKLADMAGVNQPTISRLESDKHDRFMIDTLQKIAASMGYAVMIDLVPVTEAEKLEDEDDSEA